VAAVTGGALIRARLAFIRRAVDDAIAQGMDDFADDVLSMSRDLAPQLTGLMIRTSGVSKSDSRSLGRFRRSIFYEQPYAVWQHEEVFNPGPITSAKPGAGPKFLTRALNFHRLRGQKAIGRRIQRTLRTVLR
jgi:hypothetical protein